MKPEFEVEKNKKVNRQVQTPIVYSADLAEIIGIMLGDGCLYKDKKGKYHTIVSFHLREKAYFAHVENLFTNYFDSYKFNMQKSHNERFLKNVSVRVGLYLEQAGLIHGNKLKTGVDMPNWILFEKKYIIRFIRGFFDTDGSIYRKYEQYAQIQIKLATRNMLKSLRTCFCILGYHPTKIQYDKSGKVKHAWKFYLSRQEEIDRFFEEIQPANKKHVDRYKKIRNGDVGI